MLRSQWILLRDAWLGGQGEGPWYDLSIPRSGTTWLVRDTLALYICQSLIAKMVLMFNDVDLDISGEYGGLLFSVTAVTVTCLLFLQGGTNKKTKVALVLWRFSCFW